MSHLKCAHSFDTNYVWSRIYLHVSSHCDSFVASGFSFWVHQSWNLANSEFESLLSVILVQNININSWGTIFHSVHSDGLYVLTHMLCKQVVSVFMLAGRCDLHVVFKGKLCFHFLSFWKSKYTKWWKIYIHFIHCVLFFFFLRMFSLNFIPNSQRKRIFIRRTWSAITTLHTFVVKYRLFQSYC